MPTLKEYAITIENAINRPSIKSLACLDILSTEILKCLWQSHARVRAAELATTADREADAMAAQLGHSRSNALLSYLDGGERQREVEVHEASEADYQRQTWGPASIGSDTYREAYGYY